MGLKKGWYFTGDSKLRHGGSVSADTIFVIGGIWDKKRHEYRAQGAQACHLRFLVSVFSGGSCNMSAAVGKAAARSAQLSSVGVVKQR